MRPDPTSSAGHDRRLLKVTAGLGVSTALIVAASAVRTKFVAGEFGPEGVGFIAIIQGLQAPVVLLIGLGVGTSAVVEIAAARGTGDAERLRSTRWAFLLLTSAMAILAAAVFLLGAGLLAEWFGEGEATAADFRLLAVPVALTYVAANWHATLNGFRRVRDLAKLDPMTAAAGAAVTVVLIVVGAPLVMSVFVLPSIVVTLVTLGFARRLPSMGRWPGSRALSKPVVTLVGNGIPFVLHAWLTAVGVLLLRLMIDASVGRDAFGQYQAAYAISETYVGFLLAAMAFDYLPRITEQAGDSDAVSRSANAQARISALVVLPLVVCMITAAPLVVHIFYSAAFTDAAELLRIQLIGEPAKVVAWSLLFILMARQARTLFVLTQALMLVFSLVATYLALGAFGVTGASVAYAISQAAAVGWTLAFVRFSTSGFTLSRENVSYLVGGTVVAVAIVTCGSDPMRVALTVITCAACGIRLLRLTRAQAADNAAPDG